MAVASKRPRYVSSPELEQLRDKIVDCVRCGEDEISIGKNGKERRKPRVKLKAGAMSLLESSRAPVPGFGSAMAKYMFIGEAPGSEEDGEGYPFIGRSGKYLKEKLLMLADIELAECYFTNIVKCHPYRNRDPYVAEVRCCDVWLQKEIETVNPEMIFLLGGQAVKHLLPGATLRANVGQVFEREGRLYMPLYHPAAVFHELPRDTVEEGYRNIKASIARGVSGPNVKHYSLVENIEQLLAVIEELKEVDKFSLDIETDGDQELEKPDALDPLTNILVGIGITWESNTTRYSVYVPLADYADNLVPISKFGLESWEAMRVITSNLLIDVCTQKKVYIHNAKFEMISLDKYELHFKRPFCTMMAAYTCRETTYGLKDIIHRRYGIEMTELDDVVDLKKNKVSDGNLADLYLYGCADADYCYQLGIDLEAEINADEKLSQFFYDVALPLLPWAAQIQLEGVEIDLDTTNQLRPYFKEKIDVLNTTIIDVAGIEDFNPRSAKQKSDLLFKDIGLPPTQETDSSTPHDKQWSVQAKDLDELQDSHPIVKLLSKLGSLNTIKSTFIDGVPKRLHPVDHRLHYNFSLISTRTSRASTLDPNVQNIPVRDPIGKKIRQMFIGDTNDCLIYAADYSQVELRIAAHYSLDPRMLEVFNSGLSIHAETCREVYGINEDDPSWVLNYKNSKNGNFLCLYEGEWRKLMKTLETSPEIAKKFVKGHKATYPGWWEQVEKFKRRAQRLGYAETMFGFRRLLPELSSVAASKRKAGERYAINVPIQGTAANIIWIAMVKINRWLKRKKMEARMILQIHDEVVFSCPTWELELLNESVQRIMPSVVELAVPIPIEAKVGWNWGELQDYDEFVEENKELL